LLESVKPPRENRIWFLYGGQTASYQSEGVTFRTPILVARVVEDSAGTGGLSTQTSAMAYNAQGNLTSFTDPLGRQTTFDYYLHGSLPLTGEHRTPLLGVRQPFHRGNPCLFFL